MARLTKRQKYLVVLLDLVVMASLAFFHGAHLHLGTLLVVAALALAIINLAFLAGAKYSQLATAAKGDSSAEGKVRSRSVVPPWSGWLIVGGSILLGYGYSTDRNQWVLPPLFGAVGLLLWLYVRAFSRR